MSSDNNQEHCTQLLRKCRSKLDFRIVLRQADRQSKSIQCEPTNIIESETFRKKVKCWEGYFPSQEFYADGMTVGILVDVFSDEHQLLSVEIQPGTRQLGMIGGMCGRFVEYASPLARWGVIMIEALCELFFNTSFIVLRAWPFVGQYMRCPLTLDMSSLEEGSQLVHTNLAKASLTLPHVHCRFQ